MAGGPLFPNSEFPATADRTFPNVHVSSAQHQEGMGVEASVGANATWQLEFQMPPTLPTGTGKLRLLAQATATSGAAKVNPTWGSVAVEESPGVVSLTAEGTGTITWASGDSDVYKELKIDLDADTLVAGEMVIMDLIFETASWTLAVISTWRATIIWE